METANPLSTPTPRLSLLGRALGTRRDTAARVHHHLHFDRAARVWRAHDAREFREAPAVALPECA